MSLNTLSKAAVSIFNFCGSIRFAMLLLGVIIIASIVGTLIESGFSASVAQAYVYDAPWFIFWLVLLCANLTIAVVVRFPWKAHQWGFVITHGGIVVILAGAIIGRVWGMEGSMTLQEDGPPLDFLVTGETLLQVQDSAGKLRSFPLKLNRREPTPDRTLRFKAGDVNIAVLNVTHELGIREVVEPNPSGGAPALRLVVESEAAPHPIEQWLVRDDPRRGRLALGRDVIRFASAGAPAPTMAPAGTGGTVSGGDCCGTEPPDGVVERDDTKAVASHTGEGDDCCPIGAVAVAEAAGGDLENPHAHHHGEILGHPGTGASGNDLVLRLDGDRVVYESNREDGLNTGEIELGAAFSAGWSGWRFRVEEVIEQAAVREEFAPMARAGMRSIGASGLLVRLEKGEHAVERWLEMGRMTFARLGEEHLHLGFGFRLYPLDFQVRLERFEVDFNPGTQSPAGFKSHVVFTSKSGDTLSRSVWMNNPTNFPDFPGAGLLGTSYKFSQSSWNPENLGQTTLQVIRDPGWSLKWIGSLLFCAGLLMVFYLKPYPRFARKRQIAASAAPQVLQEARHRTTPNSREPEREKELVPAGDG